MSFLDYLPPVTKTRRYVTIGNPPFGSARSHNLALDFVKHAMKFSSVVGMMMGAGSLRSMFLGEIPDEFRIAKVTSIDATDFDPPVHCTIVFVVFVCRQKIFVCRQKTIKHTGIIEDVDMPKGIRLLNPRVDTQIPNLAIVKFGANIFSTREGPDMVKEWRKSRSLGQGVGLASVFFLYVDKDKLISVRNKANMRSAELKPIYSRWVTTACNINQRELRFWLRKTEPAKSLIMPVLLVHVF